MLVAHPGSDSQRNAERNGFLHRVHTYKMAVVLLDQPTAVNEA